MDLNLTIRNQVTELPRVKAQLMEVFQTQAITTETQQDIWLMSEEILTNIIKYSDSKTIVGTIGITLRINGATLSLSFEDSGQAFNPLEATTNALLSEEIEQRPIGGLGILLVKELADRLEYHYQDGKNILTLEKNLP